MRRFTGLLVVAAIAFAVSTAPSSAAKRVALVVGNAEYPSVGNLRNPLADAAAVSTALQRLGFEVLSKHNIGAQEFRETLAVFAETSAGAELAFVYYAGHGVELDGVNYLVPTDAKLERKVAARFEAIALDDVREAVSGASKLRVVVLDACRNNPFQLAGKDGKRSLSRGLARVEPNTNELIAYSAREGTTATDGEGDNSPFALALVKHLSEPGVEIGYLFRKVRGDVVAATNGVQEPFVYATLGDEQLYFNPPAGDPVGKPEPPAAAPAAVEQPSGSAAAEYGLVKGTSSEQVLIEYIEKHGNAPIWGARALEDLEALRRSRANSNPVEKQADTEVAVVAPPKTDATNCSDLLVEVAGKTDCLKPGEVFRDIDGGPEMVVVPAGSFMMGSDDHFSAAPIHQVTIPSAFAMGRFEVTVDQFAAFVAATGHSLEEECYTRENNVFELTKGRSFRSPGYAVTGSHPASCLNWDDATAFAKWLSQSTGKTYRLPSEAEWEYAARAGASGDTLTSSNYQVLCAYANVGDLSAKGSLANSNIIECDDGHKFLAPVGSLAANPFGLHDLAGNLEEWVADCHNDSYDGAPSDGSAWMTTHKGACIRVQRGGAWDDGYWGSMSPANRSYSAPHSRQWSYGFRVVRDL